MFNYIDIHKYRLEPKIVKEMKSYSMGMMFFNLGFDVILIILAGISILLIYSLLMIGVEGRAQETGMMRMVGLTKGRFMIIIAS